MREVLPEEDFSNLEKGCRNSYGTYNVQKANELFEHKLLSDAKYQAKLNRTEPSGQAGGSPRGERTSINPQSSSDKQRGLRRENESADILANKGYDVEQNPPALPNGKNPDYRIEGKTFDNFAPQSSKPEQVRKGISNKVKEGQTGLFLILMIVMSNLRNYEIFSTENLSVIFKKLSS